MRIILYLFLFLSIICAKIKKPSDYIKKCFKKRIGKEGYNTLYDKYMKYNELNSEATFDKYIRENEPELIPLLTRYKDQEKNSIKNRIRDQINGRLKKNKSKKKYYYDDDDDDD